MSSNVFNSCGPTVYDYAHIGNFRAFLTYDLLKRWLTYIGYNVEHICNLTDIDDKIILRMATEGKSLQEITTKYTNAFFEDLRMLNIIPANKYPKATDYVSEIEEMVGNLVDKQHAYINGGSVYFKVSSFPNYNKLAQIPDERFDGVGGLGSNERKGAVDKQNSRDFALWKAYTSQDGEVYWDSKLGKGRPGWHIECSAMAYTLLGPSIDIHSGGADLVFPHHSNEIAQSEAYTGQQFARYWVHNGFVNINNEKMSKSLKNFKTLRDIVHEIVDARAFRYLILSSQYRKPLTFNNESLKGALNSLQRIDKAYAKLEDFLTYHSSAVLPDKDFDEDIQNCIEEFEKAMCDDLNTPRAFAALFSLVKLVEKLLVDNANETSVIQRAGGLIRALQKMDTVLGLRYILPSLPHPSLPLVTIPSGQSCLCGGEHSVAAMQIPDDVQALAAERAILKAEKMYAQADAMRKKIRDSGFDIKDIQGGFEIFPYKQPGS
ncbi:cysteine--tRNA ligase [archaeon]|nr:MAG: cysteine--tRNA ligase [archaeon]